MADFARPYEEVHPEWFVPRDPKTIKYGVFAENLPESLGRPTYYITTAIAYTNGYPHIGHAYEFLSTDIIVRYHRMLGYDTFFLTGTDEHGQKVATSAAAAGRTPIEHCNMYVNAFQALNQRLAVTNTDYLRTTDPRHAATAQKLWTICSEKGDIYLGSYEGWYNTREECYVADAEAAAANFMDTESGKPLVKVNEESYLFRLSRFTERLIAHIEENPSFIEPEQYRNHILARLRKEGLKDLSLSRTSFSWGIPMPPGFDERHVMYVWFDALSNYLTGVYALEPDHELARYWPASKHIIGKDIIWFHCVIWPCMLMSAEIPLPSGVFSHGFVLDKDGRKMSKSLGNIVNPHQILDRYPLDSLRYYACASVTYGADIKFSEASIISMHNSELADIVGNLVQRALVLCMKYCDGRIPDASHDPEFGLPFDLSVLVTEIEAAASACAINIAVMKAMEAARATNTFLTKAEPWKMKGADVDRRPAIVRTTLEAVYAFTHFLGPVIPIAAEEIFRRLNTPPRAAFRLRADFYNLEPGTQINLSEEVLFRKIDELGESAASPGADAAPAVAAAGKKAPAAASKPKAEVFVEDPNQVAFSKIDLRVGQIVKVWNHETADKLFCEEIDIGDGTLRPVASGLRQHYTLEQMQGRKVVVVCNLKESKLVGFISTGMVLAAKSADGSRVELVTPPEGAAVGERIMVAGISGEPWPASQVKKKKVWESVAVDLRTNSACEATWQGLPLLTSSGPCTVASNADAPIS